MQASARTTSKKRRNAPRLDTAQRAAHKAQLATQSLMNAITRDSTANYEAIFEGFAEKGIPLDEIFPRQNIFTFNAWRALGRTVRRGEHGVKVVTFVDATKEIEAKDGETTKVAFRKAHTTTVFHISQTDELDQKPV